MPTQVIQKLKQFVFPLTHGRTKIMRGTTAAKHKSRSKIMTRQKNPTTRLFAGGLMLLLVCMSNPYTFAQEQQDTQANADLMQMSLEELMNVEVESTASLTKTTHRRVPSTVTTIPQEEIWNSGARNLDELLDIYVPNFEWVRHPWEYNHLGLRGITSDRDMKYLLLVNGKVMNEHTHYGALAERDLPTMRDIHHIDVIRGPGSALYGPGAIAMVINIVTENALTFQGSEVTGRVGAVEEFYSGEYKYAEKYSSDSGLYIYTGISDYLGADTGDAPFIWGGSHAIDQPFHNNHDAGDAVSFNTARDNEQFKDRTKPKLFTEYTNGNFDVWARYTRGGGSYGPDLFGSMWDANPKGWSSGYQQATVYASNKSPITETLALDYAGSFKMTDFAHLNGSDGIADSHREDEYYGRLLARWNPNEVHSVAFGGELSREEFGLEPLQTNSPAIHGAFADPSNPDNIMPRWSTNLWSMLGEHQWNINEQFTTFVGGRIDLHPYTPMMFSPRAVVVFTPNEKDTLKASFSRSVRVPQAADLKSQWDTTREKIDPEKINVWELRYERQQSKKLWLAGSLYYQDQDVVGAASGVKSVGTLRTWGFEIEATYKTDRTRFTASHGFTKVYDFSDTLNSDYPPTMSERGYRRELVAWSPNITKFTGQYKLTDRFNIDGALRIYWGFPGQKDYATSRWDFWENTVGWNGWCYDETHDETFGPSAFLNLGLQFKPSKDLTIRVDGYNLLGIFDIGLNKRPMAYDQLYPADARASAPAIAVSLQYKF